MTTSTNCTVWISNMFKQTSFQLEWMVRYAIKMTLQTAVLSLLTTTPVTDSLCTLRDDRTTKRHRTSVNFRSKVCVNKRLLSHWTELSHENVPWHRKCSYARIYIQTVCHINLALRSLLMLPSTGRLLVFARFRTINPSAQHTDYRKCNIV